MTGDGKIDSTVKQRTAESFAFEWDHFSVSPEAMEDNFWGYFQFFSAEFFSGKSVLEAGSGMGRHTFHLATHARRVVAIDLGEAIKITARNAGRAANAFFVQADIDALPFRDDAYDFICSIGVLHHLPDPEGGFGRLLRCLRPGGHVLVYLYWSLNDGPYWKRVILSLVTQTRRITTRLPHHALLGVALVATGIGYGCFSLPYRFLSRIPSLSGFAESMPLKRYAVDGFRVCYNDQFDRFSAPIENRYTEDEVRGWFDRAGLVDVRIAPHFGWLACGRKPLTGA